MTPALALRLYTATAVAFVACTTACHAAPESKFAAELQACVAVADSRAQADACRDEVEKRYEGAEGYTPRDAGGDR